MLNPVQHKRLIKKKSIQVIFPYELMEASDSDSGEFLWFEVCFIGEQTGKPAAPRPFLKESDARDYIIQELTHKESVHK